MFENNNKKISLMIVCDDDCMEYANYLMGLVGQNDDKPEQVVGTKDGTVHAGINTIKVYRDNLPQLSSDEHILFIGDFKEAKSIAKSINIKFNRYGMCYGWLGKRAVMYVDDKSMKIKEYKEFIEFANKYLDKFKVQDIHDNIATESVKWAFLNTFMPITFPFFIKGVFSGNLSPYKKQITEQQYRCLTMVLYMEGLRKFLEE